MQPELLVENHPSRPLDLDPAEVANLDRLGRALASDKRWWGATTDEEPTRSAIELKQSPTGATLTIRNAVGVIGTGRRTIVVEPKIPIPHLLYLAQRGGLAARTDVPHTNVEATRDVWSIVAEWFCAAVRRLVRHDLIKDYRVTVNELPLVRGRIHLLATSRRFTAGRLAITCEYTEFDQDTPLNRILKSATHYILTSTSLADDLRRNARRLTPIFEPVGELQRGDLDATIDRRTAHYRDAIDLGRLILVNRDLDIRGGDRSGHTALIRTPELVENGIRAILEHELRTHISVTKRGLTLRPTTLTLTPDLVFDAGQAVGDVKYQIVGEYWVRNHLYQATTFATGYKCQNALVIGFGTSRPPPKVEVGAVRLSVVLWPTHNGVPPDEAAATMSAAVWDWYVNTAAAGGDELAGRRGAL
jgi:5-methylcytosine-specific restriction enzyme subunit McrC